MDRDIVDELNGLAVYQGENDTGRLVTALVQGAEEIKRLRALQITHFPKITFDEGGTLWVLWDRVWLSLDEDGFSYTIADEVERMRAGKYNDWPNATKEIQAALATTPK